MTDASEDRLNELSTRGTKAVLSPGERFRLWLLVFVTVLSLTLVAGYFANKQATSNVADCTNANLGSRNAPAAADANAHIQFAKAQAVNSTDLAAALQAGPGQQAAIAAFIEESKVFAAASDTYQAQLSADQADRQAHPLGKC